MGEKGFVILRTSHSTGGKPKTADTERIVVDPTDICTTVKLILGERSK